MILNSRPTEIVTSEDFQEIEFGIKPTDMGLVLEILRSKMYAHPIKAICREITANARDANREVENLNTISIFIQDSPYFSSDPTICIKDEGPGISPQRMADVFVNYGASTKRGTNTQTGGFGLGAKTPFSYTDSFSIVTIYDKIRYTYIAAIEEGRRGKIYLLEKVPVDEPTGTTIVIPMKSGDQEQFEKAIYDTTAHWTPQPVYQNFKYIKTEGFKVFYETEDFKLVETLDRSEKFSLIIDEIPYAMSITEIIRGGYSSGYWGFRHWEFMLKFQTGELTISANRENVQYDEPTVAKIREKLTKVCNYLKSIFLQELFSKVSWIERMLFVESTSERYSEFNIYSWTRQFLGGLEGENCWGGFSNDFEGVPLTSSLNRLFKVFEVFHVHVGTGRKEKVHKISRMFTKLPVYYQDTLRTSTACNRTIYAQSNGGYLLVRPSYIDLFEKFLKTNKKEKRNSLSAMKNYRDKGQVDYSTLFKLGISILKYSTITPTPLPKKSYVPKMLKSHEILYRRVLVSDLETSSRYYTANIAEGKCDLDCNRYFYQPTDNIRSKTGITDSMRLLSIHSVLTKQANWEIIFVNNRKAKFFKGHLKSLAEMVQSFDDKIPFYMDYCYYLENKDDMSILWKIKFISKAFGVYQPYIDTISKCETLKNQISTHRYCHSMHFKQYQQPLMDRSTLYSNRDTLGKLYKAFPILTHVSDYGRNVEKVVADYVRQTEENLIFKGVIV